MQRDNILDINQVMDHSQSIRCRIDPQDGSDWVPHGQYIVLNENGQLRLKITYRHGIAHGRYLDFWGNGKTSCEGQYQDGKKDGTWHFYNKDGTIHAVIEFEQDKETDSSQYLYNEDGTLDQILQLSRKKARD